MVRRELVVARYNEDVRWVLESPMPVTVYNKGDALAIDHPNVDIIDLPNVGREAGSWLDHIVTNYGMLADWTFLAQGWPHQDVQDFFRRLGVEYTDTTSLTSQYMETFPNKQIKAKDRVEYHGNHEVRYGLADPVTPGVCDAGNLPCEVIWRAFGFTGPMPSPWYFGYAAQWAIPRHRITDRPLEFWRWLRDKVCSAGSRLDKDPHNAWAAELCWMYLLGDASKYPVMIPGTKKVKKTLHLKRESATGMASKGGCGCGGGKKIS